MKTHSMIKHILAATERELLIVVWLGKLDQVSASNKSTQLLTAELVSHSSSPAACACALAVSTYEAVSSTAVGKEVLG